MNCLRLADLRYTETERPHRIGRPSLTLPRYALVDLQQHGEAFADFIDQLGRGHAGDFDISSFPGYAPRLIGQYDT